MVYGDDEHERKWLEEWEQQRKDKKNAINVVFDELWNLHVIHLDLRKVARRIVNKVLKEIE